MKVRIDSRDAGWKNDLIWSLARATGSCPNFKVRIHATAALKQLDSLDTLGGPDQGLLLVKALEVSLKNAENLDGVAFGEVQYQKQLLAELQELVTGLRGVLPPPSSSS
ncbi:hypothetical protein HDU67_004638 [Dinochytrium kinnereticum]|nr:hypothetical protein HDU67_004638 [Dinochytrium kinnereticum]